jgi:CBS-domain-containing membrane protein
MLQTSKRRSLKTQWLLWRARLSIPSLLGRADERTVISVVAAVNGAIAILTISLFAWLSDLPLVFPALGPTAFILFTTPFSRSAAPRSVILGHLTAIASGYAVWRVISHINGGAVSLEIGGWPMFLSGSLALAVTCLLLVRFSLPHPPACGSALVVALGGVTHWSGLLIMGVAVILVTAQAVAMHRICCLPVPTWRPRDHDPPA